MSRVISADYWRTEYDWRRCEARLNELGQFRTYEKLAIWSGFYGDPEPVFTFDETEKRDAYVREPS
jgi:hypothetical protein